MNLQSLIGTQAFLPATLSYMRDAASPAPLPIDQVIFQSILLCLTAWDKHLIIRTPEEDLGLAVQLTVWTLSSVFDLSTHKVKIRKRQKKSLRSARSSTAGSHRHASNGNGTDEPRQLIDEFLRSLFLHSTNPSSPYNELYEEHVRAQSGHAHGSTSRKHYSKHLRQSSFPTNLTAVSHSQSKSFPDNASTSPNTTGLLFQSALDNTLGSSPLALPSILKPQPLYAFQRPAQSPYTKSPSPRLSHANIDPFPVPGSRRKKSRSQPLRQDDTKNPKNLPQALVISGLENASISVQRSFSGVLGDKKFLIDDKTGEGGEWTLPEGFICVYVCPWNGRERPAIHKTLLDKFAMSANAFISQSVQSDFRLLPFILSSVATSPRPLPHSNPGSPSSPVLQLPPTHTPPIHMKPLPGHSHQHQMQVRPSAQRGLSLTPPPLGTLALAHPPHSPPHIQQTRPSTPFRLPSLLPPGFLEPLRAAYLQTYMSYSLDLYLSDLMSATRLDSRLDGTLLTAQSMRDARDLVKASRVIGADLTGMELVRPVHSSPGQENEHDYSQSKVDEEEFHSTHSNPEHLEALPDSRVKPVFEVSEVDVARIFPRVVSHRLKLRDGPHDEILSSLLYGATVEPLISAIPEGKAFESVKAVLVNILSEV